MFVSKKLHNKMIKAKENEITELRQRIEKQEKSLKDMRYEIDGEHLENYKNHRKLLAIKNLLKEQDCNSIDNLKNKIKTILNKKELDGLSKHI